MDPVVKHTSGSSSDFLSASNWEIVAYLANLLDHVRVCQTEPCQTCSRLRHITDAVRDEIFKEKVWRSVPQVRALAKRA